MRTVNRCHWAGSDPDYIAYHDKEWGVPVHDDRKHFEMLTLEGFQAGLSWLTILRRRPHFRHAFAGWDWNKVAAFSAADIRRLLRDKGIIRNRLKIKAAVGNAKCFIQVRKEYGTFDRYIWQFTGGRPIVNAWRTLRQLPARTFESDAMSRDLKARGFTFVGSTICYAHMQATGMVNDHLVSCPRHGGLGAGG